MQQQVPLPQPKQVAMKPWMQIEIIIASLLPVAIILIIGVIGSRQLIAGDSNAFIFLILGAIVLVFVGELLLLRFTQKTIKQPLTELINTGQEYIAGNRGRRAAITGNDEAATLARVLNTLLDMHTQEQQDAIYQSQHEMQLIDGQILQLIHEVEPVLGGDLRVKAVINSGSVSILSDVCNYLIEELIQLVKWTRYSAGQVIDTTSNLLERSIDLAQTTETQMHRLSQTSEAVERIVAFVQRTSSNLQLGVEISQEIQFSIQEQKKQLHATEGKLVLAQDVKEQEVYTFLEKLETETQRQIQLLASVLQSTQGTISIAETTISDIYAFAERINQSSLSILKTAERVSSLGTLAEQWRNSVVEFHLSDEDEQQISSPDDEELPGSTPTTPMKRI